MSATRTDSHRPSAVEFDPEAYNCHGVFDTNPEFDMGEIAARRAAVSGLVDLGYSFGAGSSTQCGHCGARIRYAALMVRDDLHQFIFVGETCLDNRFELTKGEFDTLRKTASLNRERMARTSRLDTLLAEHPSLVWASYAHNIESAGGEPVFYARDDWAGTEYATEAEVRATLPAFQRDDHWAVGAGFKRNSTLGEKARIGWEASTLADIWSKIVKYADPSSKQIAFVESLVSKISAKAEAAEAREIAAAALQASGVEVPTGRITIEGEVLSTKVVDNDYGSTLKMLVQNAEGWKVWGTVPSSIDVEKGSRVRFVATVEQSKDDALFGFFRRPAKAQVL